MTRVKLVYDSSEVYYFQGVRNLNGIWIKAQQDSKGQYWQGQRRRQSWQTVPAVLDCNGGNPSYQVCGTPRWYVLGLPEGRFPNENIDGKELTRKS